MATIGDNLQAIRARLGPVILLAVSKGQSSDAVRQAAAAGQKAFGENYVQEGVEKMEALPGLEWHLIGPLQSNKTKEAVALFDCIETLDRPKLAAALASEIQRQGKAPRLLIQVNIGLEPQKAGIAPADTAAFARRCTNEFGLDIGGLMCIPPFEEDPLPHFEKLRALGDELGLPELSMGMSGDFEEAIGAGATIVRVGSAIFGSR